MFLTLHRLNLACEFYFEESQCSISMKAHKSTCNIQNRTAKRILHQTKTSKCLVLLAVVCVVIADAYRTHPHHHHHDHRDRSRTTDSFDDYSSNQYYGGGRSVLDEFRDRKISYEAEKLTGQELVDYVNSHQKLWKAKLNTKFMDYSRRVKYGLMGVKHVHLSTEDKKYLSPTRRLDMYIPEQFDAREHWDQCQSLKNIRDQSSCGSCWAFGAVEAMSDRICIASKGKIQVSLSADDLLSCCHSCGFGCDGGDPLAAWKYWVKEGIVTGSNFTLKQGCKPYPFPPCEHHSNKTHYQPCKHDLYPTPKCEKKCVSNYTAKSYMDDKFYGSDSYGVEDDVESIQKELLTHGPVEVAFEVYDDFLTYDSGIYVHTGGKLGGGHAVKMLGWGVEQGVPYWLVANSWNTDWGENGFFRILRGVDECGIESGVVAGIPKLNRTHKKFYRRFRLGEEEDSDTNDSLF